MGTYQYSLPTGETYEIDAPTDQAAMQTIGQLQGGAGSGQGSQGQLPSPSSTIDPFNRQVDPNATASSPPFMGALPGRLPGHLPPQTMADQYPAIEAITQGLPFGPRIQAAATSAETGVPYAQTQPASQAQAGEFAKGSPWTAAAGDIAALAPAALIPAGPGIAGAAPTLAARAGYGALAGAGIGGLQGASSSPDLTDVPATASSTALGAGLGAGVGFAAPYAGAALGRAVSPLARGLMPGMSAEGVSSGALNKIGQFMSPDDLAAAQSKLATLGPQGTIADTGESALGLAQGAAGAVPEARTILANTLDPRNAGTNARINAAVSAPETGFGPYVPATNIEAGLQAERAATGPAYEEALKNAPPVDISNVLNKVDELSATAKGSDLTRLNNVRSMLSKNPPAEPTPIPDEILQDPAFAVARQRVMRDALTKSTDATAIDPNTLDRAAASVVNGEPVEGAYAKVATRPIPEDNAEALQSAKKQIDDKIGELQRSGSNNAARQMVIIRNALNDELAAASPDYAAANAAFARPAQASEALEAGKGVLNPNLEPAAHTGQFGAYSPENQAASRSGTRVAIEQALGNNANDLAGLNRAIKGEGDWAGQKLGTTFGQQNTSNVYDTLANEQAFRDTNQAVLGGSQTGPRLTAGAAFSQPPPGPLARALMDHIARHAVTGVLGAAGGGYEGGTPGAIAGGLVGSLGVGGLRALARGNPAKYAPEIAKIISAQGENASTYATNLGNALARRAAITTGINNTLTSPGISALAAGLAAHAAPTNHDPKRASKHVLSGSGNP